MSRSFLQRQMLFSRKAMSIPESTVCFNNRWEWVEVGNDRKEELRMLCEKKESLIRKGLLRNQQPRVFMSNVHKLIDLLVNSKTTTEEIMKSVDKWIADYDPAWYQLEAQLPAMQEQDRFL